ncbi:hypothetical protein ACJJTC_013255 [Scirpophaga incertulas]
MQDNKRNYLHRKITPKAENHIICLNLLHELSYRNIVIICVLAGSGLSGSQDYGNWSTPSAPDTCVRHSDAVTNEESRKRPRPCREQGSIVMAGRHVQRTSADAVAAAPSEGTARSIPGRTAEYSGCQFLDT